MEETVNSSFSRIIRRSKRRRDSGSFSLTSSDQLDRKSFRLSVTVNLNSVAISHTSSIRNRYDTTLYGMTLAMEGVANRNMYSVNSTITP